MRVLLVNSNRLQPPVAPIALDYLGRSLQVAGHTVDLLDLCFEEDPLAAVDRCLARAGYGLVGVTVRNTDDCFYPGQGYYLPEVETLVRRLRQGSDAPVVLGGVGFSVMPEAVLRVTGAELGIRGEGEFAFTRLAGGEEEVPGLVRRRGNGYHSVPPETGDLTLLPLMTRDLVDNARYYQEGGHIGIETKRGCAGACIYCADPVAKGCRVRARPPAAVADEVAQLAGQGILHLHTCDSEFNRPLEHALAVCEEMVARGLAERVRWYAYCAPAPFPEELAVAMRRAGCIGMLIGADSGDPAMLRRLGRDFGPDDVRAAVEHCRRHGITSYVSLLVGSPGETPESVRTSIALMHRISPDLVGICAGVRIYPGTPLERELSMAPESRRSPGQDLPDYAQPRFFLSPEVGEGVFALVREAAAGDPRFLIADPNTTDRTVGMLQAVTGAIRKGYRGAHWDILRRIHLGLPPG